MAYVRVCIQVSNLNLTVKRRTEHLSAADLSRHEQISSMFGMGSGSKGAVVAEPEDEELQSSSASVPDEGMMEAKMERAKRLFGMCTHV
jgi:hypothetical protein